ncbi:MAG: 2-C-methyl-D-erythritol 4-phosphate cytidylyltransferase, partial [Verrucomicrobia bacterium]|nr:2-C-methyl-D-erythritol 4-phosphate cytidylyltransferase [Verrucomicrobiota bacterium]
MSIAIFLPPQYAQCMYLGKTIGACLLMAGNGSRFGGDVPKQFLMLGAKPIYLHALDTLVASRLFDEIILVCHPEWMDLPHDGIVRGGATRQESSYRGLKGFKAPPDIVLIHDAVRPFVTERILRDNIETAIQYGAADTCIPSADTLVHAPDGKTLAAIPNRRELFRGQTPQTFRMDWILHAHEQTQISNATDDCQLVLKMGKPIHLVLGDEKN